MKIILINGSSTPLYEQIKNAIKENIVGNTVASDAQLPSVRQLSKELGVSILTVKKAYDELEREGFIVIRQGLGTFVTTMNQEILKDEKISKLVVGYNKEWKQEINIGSKNNQNFVSIPFRKILDILKYKLEDNGIEYKEQEESYTSKASYLDNDNIPIYKEETEEIK